MTNYEYLFMFPEKEKRTSLTVSSFKMQAVDFVAKKHSYTVLALVGDSWSDLVQFPTQDDEDEEDAFDFGELDNNSSFIVQRPSTITTLLKLGKTH